MGCSLTVKILQDEASASRGAMNCSCYEAVVDTSFLLFVVDRRVDVIDVLLGSQVPICKILIPLAVLRELQALAEAGKSARAIKASIALKLVEQALKSHRGLVVVLEEEPPGGTTDDKVIAAAAGDLRILVTADKRMKRRARELGVKAYLLAKSSLRLC